MPITNSTLNHACSFEYWSLDEYGRWRLHGGLYGVIVGRIFYGESMFSLESDASKIAFVHAVDYLRSKGISLIDCQIHTEHLARLGAREIAFTDFSRHLNEYSIQSLFSPIKPALLVDNLGHDLRHQLPLIPIQKVI